MKIKTKKTMNLLQLIEHIIKTDYKPEVYKSNTTRAVVEVGVLKSIIFKTIVFPEDIFTVETEIEITEDTVLPKLVTRNTTGSYNEWINHSVNAFRLKNVEAIYIPNDDFTLTLIWRDGKLVE